MPLIPFSTAKGDNFLRGKSGSDASVTRNLGQMSGCVSQSESLSEFMVRRHLGVHVPALKEKWVGRKTYASLVEYLSKYDLGHNFNTEWEKRIKKLKRYSIKHDIYVFAALRKYNGRKI